MKKEVPNRIQEVEIDIVRVCNLKCKMCNYWLNSPNPERCTADELKRAIKQLHEWLNRKFRITFAGGEPFIREDFLDIVRYASELGNIITTTVTNGTLITEERVKEILKSGLHGITFSIDSLNSDKHDYIRGVKGTFNKAFTALSQLHKLRGSNGLPYISIASIVSNFNHEDVIEILKWVAKKNIGSLIIQAISYNFFNSNEIKWYQNKLWPKSKRDVAKICKSLQELIEMKKQGYPLINPLPQLYEMIDYFQNLDMWWVKNGRTNM